ncbi:MAG: hypothetical protein ACR2PL_16295 [Dehalococcoidia bacterium]
MKTFIARSSWLAEEGCRLDAPAYGEGGLAIRDRIIHGTFGWQPLGKVCDLFYPPRFARQYVRDPERGTLFLSSSDMLLADLKGLAYLSEARTPGLTGLLVQGGWTLISRSGTVGNTAYVRPEMAGLAASEHIIRAAPLRGGILPGYLFAFLASRGGTALIRSRTYGSIVQHIEPQHIADLPVPVPDEREQQGIHNLVVSAAAARTEASHLLDETAAYFDGLAGPMPSRHDHALATGCVRCSQLGLRLDAFHNVGWATEAGRLAGTPIGELGLVSRPGISKRIFVERGVPFVSGIDVYQTRVTFRQRLMRVEAERAGSILQYGQILVQRSGQRYGLLGRPAYVGAEMDGWAGSEDLLKIALHTRTLAGAVFAFLRSGVGHRTVLRTSYGTSIPHLNPEDLSSIEVPPLPEILADKAQRALELREQADSDEERAIQEVEARLA